jgi:hypothetical protein
MLLLLRSPGFYGPLRQAVLQFFGVFSAHMGDKGHIVYDDQVGGHCCWLDAVDW